MTRVLPAASAAQREILSVLMASPEHTASSTEVAAYLGYGSYVVVHGLFARLCKAVFIELQTLHRRQRLQRRGQWWLVLAERGERDTHGFPWRVRPAVVRALTALSFAPDRFRSLKASSGCVG